MALASVTPSACAPETFPTPALFGAQFLSLEVVQVTNYSAAVPQASRFGAPAVDLVNANFCNVTVSYTHPGQNDIIHVETWLPTETWNGKFNAVGGGGFNAGRYPTSYESMAGALGDGYATVTTDAGLGFSSEVNSMLWLLASPGNLNLYSLQNLAAASLIDEVRTPRPPSVPAWDIEADSPSRRRSSQKPSSEATTARTRLTPTGSDAPRVADRVS